MSKVVLKEKSLSIYQNYTSSSNKLHHKLFIPSTNRLTEIYICTAANSDIQARLPLSSDPVVGQREIMKPEGRVPCGVPLVHDPRVHFRLHPLLAVRKRVLPGQLGERRRGRQWQRQRAGLAHRPSRRVRLAVPHDHVKKDRLQGVAVQGQLLAEGDGVEATDGAGRRHHPRQDLLARHPRDDQQLGRALRLPVEVPEPRPRGRHLEVAVVLHDGRDVDETLLKVARDLRVQAQ